MNPSGQMSWPDIYSALVDISQSWSPQGLSVLIYKIDIGLEQLWQSLIQGSSSSADPF